MTVVVTGMGLISAGGNRVGTWSKLLSQGSAIAIAQPFPELPPCPLALIGETPADLKGLTQTLVHETLTDACLIPPLPDLGIVVGSSRSTQMDWEILAAQKLESCNVPLHLLSEIDLLPLADAPGRWCAQVTGSRGVVKSPMSACTTAMVAIAQGYDLICNGECEQVLAGAVETPITPLTLAGFHQMGALAKTGCYPFDRHREGLVLGEGGAFFLLESLTSARKRQARIYGEILGWGFTCDAYHVSTPHPHRTSAAIALKTCLERAKLTPELIDYLHAHGTSTRLNDAAESQLISEVLPISVPVSSTKGVTGHTLGASGALGIAFCFLAIQYQVLPPCVGLTHPAFELNWVRSPHSQPIDYALCLSFGFGGNNGAIAVGRSHKTRQPF